jgi:hypothetical protein
VLNILKRNFRKKTPSRPKKIYHMEYNPAVLICRTPPTHPPPTYIYLLFYYIFGDREEELEH